jgi:hypothetical protein
MGLRYAPMAFTEHKENSHAEAQSRKGKFNSFYDNQNFKPIEFDGFKKQAGLNSFTLTPKQWIEKTNAVGIISKRGKSGESEHLVYQ